MQCAKPLPRCCVRGIRAQDRLVRRQHRGRLQGVRGHSREFYSTAYRCVHVFPHQLQCIYAYWILGRMDPSVPRSKRLLTDARSNVFVYLTGHGGNEFLKFQDNEEISAFDVADAFEQMWQKKRCARQIYLDGEALLTSWLAKVQRTAVHDRYLPSKHDVFQDILAQHSLYWLIRVRRELLLCMSNYIFAAPILS